MNTPTHNYRNCGSDTESPEDNVTNVYGQEVNGENSQSKIITFKKILKFVFNIFKVLLGIVVVWALIKGWLPGSNKVDIDNMREAYEISQEVILEQVISPESTDFPRFDTSFISRSQPLIYEGEEYNIYTVSSYFDTENVFGVEMRSNYVIQIGFPKDSNNENYYYEIISWE